MLYIDISRQPAQGQASFLDKKDHACQDDQRNARKKQHFNDVHILGTRDQAINSLPLSVMTTSSVELL